MLSKRSRRFAEQLDRSFIAPVDAVAFMHDFATSGDHFPFGCGRITGGPAVADVVDDFPDPCRPSREALCAYIPYAKSSAARNEARDPDSFAGKIVRSAARAPSRGGNAAPFPAVTGHHGAGVAPPARVDSSYVVFLLRAHFRQAKN